MIGSTNHGSIMAKRKKGFVTQLDKPLNDAETWSLNRLNNAVILQFLEQGFHCRLHYDDRWDGKQHAPQAHN
jgi:hypothetical protein